MAGPNHHRSTSEALVAIVQDFPKERLSLQDLIDGLGERSFGFLLLLCAALGDAQLHPKEFCEHKVFARAREGLE